MNSDFVLVRGASPRWFWEGRNLWGTRLEDAKVIATRAGAERTILRRQHNGQWGNVGYMTVEEAREAQTNL